MDPWTFAPSPLAGRTVIDGRVSRPGRDDLHLLSGELLTLTELLGRDTLRLKPADRPIRAELDLKLSDGSRQQYAVVGRGLIAPADSDEPYCVGAGFPGLPL